MCLNLICKQTQEKTKVLLVKVSGLGHEQRAQGSCPPADFSGSVDSLPLQANQSHWQHPAKPGSDLSRSVERAPVELRPSSPPSRSPGLAQGRVWSSSWVTTSCG